MAAAADGHVRGAQVEIHLGLSSKEMWRAVSLTIGLLLGATALGIWVTHVGQNDDISDRKLSDAYVQALAHGQSHLLVEPDPKVLAQADPFNSPARQFILYDASLYNGHYYLYFGIVPYVVLLVPVYLLTGIILSPAAAIIFFLILGHIAYAAILLVVFSHLKPRPPWALAATLCGLLWCCGGTSALLGRPAIYEIENASAYASLALAIFAYLSGQFGLTGRGTALATASLFAALCIGCRPNYFPAVTVIAFWLARDALGNGPETESRSLRLILALFPLIAVGAGLATWNYTRFGNFLEFGLKYTVSTDPRLYQPLFSINNFGCNIARYLVGPIRLIRYFPFIGSPGDDLVAPGPFQELSNQVYGALFMAPILLCGIAATLQFSTLLEPRIRKIVTLLAAAGLTNLALLSFAALSSYRYAADFQPPLFAALIVPLGAWLCLLSKIWQRILLFSGFTVLALWTLIMEISLPFSIAETHLDYSHRFSSTFRKVARVFDAPIFIWERLLNVRPRSVSARLILPTGKQGQSEPLLLTGVPGAEDILYVYYESPKAIRLGFESSGYGGPLSEPIYLDYSREHLIAVDFGSFLPPDDHPIMRKLPDNDRAIAKRILSIRIDDRIVFEAFVHFHATRGRILLGVSPDEHAFGKRFTGIVVQSLGSKLSESADYFRWMRSDFGPMIVEYTPRPLPEKVYDPIISAGYRGFGYLVLAEQMDRKVRFLWCTAEGVKSYGPWIPWMPGQTYQMEVDCFAMYPPDGSSLWESRSINRQKSRNGSGTISVDGVSYLKVDLPAANFLPTNLHVGEDSISSVPSVMPSALGTLRIVRRADW